MLTKLLISAVGCGALFFSYTAFAAPITVTSVLHDCDGVALTVGPPFGAAPPCTTEPITGNPQVGTYITNGDFIIMQTEPSPVLGDGIDERTKGIFNFTSDPNYAAFNSLIAQPHGKIFAAILSLVLTPKDPLYTTDQFGLANGPFVGSPDIGNQLTENDVAKLVTLNLLNYYSQLQLENFFMNGGGHIVMQFGDDSIVSGAAMTLTANVPEPGTTGLLLIGLLPLLWIDVKRRHRA